MVIAYATTRFLERRPEGTTRACITALVSISNALGLDCSEVRSPQLELLLRRYRQLYPSKKREKRHPVTFSILLRLVAAVSKLGDSTIPAPALRALLLCLFFGWHRPGELLFTGPDNTPPPLRCHVSRTAASHSTLRLLDSKTDLFAEGCDVILPRVGGKYCPVTAIEAAMDAAPDKSLAAPIFQAADGRPVTYAAFSAILARLVVLAKLKQLHIRPHSFRIGAATTAALLGFPASTIKVLGRWRSVAYQLYTRLQPVHVGDIASAMIASAESKPSLGYGQIAPKRALDVNFSNLEVVFTSCARPGPLG